MFRPFPDLKPFLTGICLLFSFLQGFGQLRADFSFDKSGGCSPLLIHLTPQVSGASGAAVYSWDLGNGNTSAVSNPEAVYVQTGTYTVTLTVTDGGSTTTASHTVTVYNQPTASFTAGPSKVCSTPITFTSTSTAGSGTVNTFLWDFGDGITQTSYSASTTHSYSQLGVFPVSLTVTNSDGCSAVIQKNNVVTILAPLIASFTSDRSVLCNVTDPVIFTNASYGPGTLSYAWDFGDGGKSTAVSPTYSYSKKGTYPVGLTVTSTEGCVTSTTLPSSLNVANYSSDFTMSANPVCANDIVYFTSTSNPYPTSSYYTVNGASNYGGYASFPAAGTYTVTLNNTFGSCPQTAVHTITVNPTPAPQPFTAVVNNVCGPPTTVNFTDATPAVTAWAWNFNPGNSYTGEVTPASSSSGPKASAAYTPAGYYQANLTVTNKYGCSATTYNSFQITYPSYSITYTGSPQITCNTPITANFSITNTAGLVSYSWNFGDGTTNTTSLTPTHTYNTPGAYNVTLSWKDNNGCTGTSNSISFIISKPIPTNLDFSGSPTTLCIGQSAAFSSSNTGDANSIIWNYGDGDSYDTHNTHSYTSAGTYPVTLTASNIGCSNSVTKTSYITVLPAPGSFGGHTNTCADTRGLVTFAFNPSGTTSETWSWGDGTASTTVAGTTTSITHTYAKTGTFYPSVSYTNGTCSASSSDVVYVLLKQHPTISASAAKVCSNGSINVTTNLTINPADYYSGNYYDYTPHFLYSDGTPFNGQVNYPYNGYNNGSYTWSLINFDATKSGLQLVTTSYYFGCNDTSNVIPLTYVSPATAAISVVTDNQCYTQPVVIKDASDPGANNTIKSWSWSWGDGSAGSTQAGGTLSHTYTNPGGYTVGLTVTDAQGCVSSSTATSSLVRANGPKASFYPSPGTTVHLNTDVFFSNTTNAYGAPNTQYTWDFGDGTSSTAFSPDHLYAVAGTYTVVLVASNPDDKSCTSVYWTTITVVNFNSHFQVSAQSAVQSKCPPVLASFVNTSYDYTSYTWDFGDGTTLSNVWAPSHVYTQPGRYIVTLNVYGYNGLTGSYVDSVIVDKPAASLSIKTSALCEGQTGTLLAAAANTGQYTWDFGDGAGSSTNYPDTVVSHVYAASGDYEAQVLVTDANGCVAAGNAPVEMKVNPPPTVDITPKDPYLCLGQSQELTATGGVIYSWSPVAGLDLDNVATVLAMPSVTTTYKVLVTDGNGCQNSNSVTLQVVTPPTITVTPADTTVCSSQPVQMKATGADVWNWTDAQATLTSTTIGDPVATLVETTTYVVEGSDSHSCFTSTATARITVLAVPRVDAGSDIDVLAAEPMQIFASGSSDIVKWSWSPADYLSCTDCEQPITSPKKPLSYIVTVTGEDGCKASDTVNVHIICEEVKVRIPEAFSPNGDGNNDRFMVMGIGEVDHMVIYDRWGAKMFERSNFYPADASGQWDGTLNGKPQPAAAYIYFVEMTCPAGGKFYRRGTVVLVR